MPSPSAIELARTTRSDLALLEKAFAIHLESIKNYDLAELRTSVAVLSERVVRLEKAKDESDKRQWQFVYIFAGGMATLLVTGVVQLLISVLKK